MTVGSGMIEPENGMNLWNCSFNPLGAEKQQLKNMTFTSWVKVSNATLIVSINRSLSTVISITFRSNKRRPLSPISNLVNLFLPSHSRFLLISVIWITWLICEIIDESQPDSLCSGAEKFNWWRWMLISYRSLYQEDHSVLLLRWW